MSLLFQPLRLGALELRNRVAVSPMCMYSADDGCASDWHVQHFCQYGYSGAGLFMVEATAVERRGRISHGDLGLYSQANELALQHALGAARRFATGTRFGIQLAHAGRKAAVHRPWVEHGRPLRTDEDGWAIVAPSPLPFNEHSQTPHELSESEIEGICESFTTAARRAARVGFDVIELHCAHGYLIHQFLSPLSNRRTDHFGGLLDNRLRFPLMVARSVRDVLPAHVVLGARITGTDWAEGGVNLDEAVAFAAQLKTVGLDYVCVSSGGVVPGVHIPVAEKYQVPFAERVRRETGLLTEAVGMIYTAEQVEDILAHGQADFVAMARAFLNDPRWVWHAAEQLGVEVPAPAQYARGASPIWPPAAQRKGTA